MDIKNGLVDAIGNTPMLRLRRASEETGCEILGKAEFLNPGQSVKDRAALYIIKDAMKRGTLKPGGVIVEGTAGNTGIGLALVGNALGFRSVIVIPETQSQEKKDMLRLCGAELIEVPAVPYKDPNNYVKYSGRLAEELAAKDAADKKAKREKEAKAEAEPVAEDGSGDAAGADRVRAHEMGRELHRGAAREVMHGGLAGRIDEGTIARLKTGDRRRRDDRAGLLRLHVRHGIFVAQHHALQQHADGFVEPCHIDLGEFAADAAIACIVEENVEAAEFLHRMIDEVLYFVFMRDIGAAIGEVRAQLALHRLALVVLQVGGDDFRAFLQE